MPAVPADRIVGCASGGVIAAGRFLGYELRTVVDDGIWTWFNDPRAVVRNGHCYVGWVNSSGDVGVTKHNLTTKASTHFTLRSAMEVDDHDNVAIHFAPDGRVVCFYCKHNDGSGMRLRVSTSPEDISSFSAEVLLGSVTKPVTYANPHYLSATGKTYLHYRSGQGGAGDNPMNVRASSDFSTWDTERTWITQTGQRPYIKSTSNGIDKKDFFFTNCHPNEGNASLYHCYMQLDGATEKFYKTNGTYISNGSVTPAQATQIYDGSTVDAWVWDIAYGADGHPRVLFTIYPTTLDQRFMFSRWTGTEWTTPVEITTGGAYLYAGEQHYSGGLCFDSQDTNVVYLSTPVSGIREIQEWRTADSGATWAKHRDITTGTPSGTLNARPYSPRNRDSSLRVLWWSGSYSSFTSYNTSIKGR